MVTSTQMYRLCVYKVFVKITKMKNYDPLK